jgi:hypothetical protein
MSVPRGDPTKPGRIRLRLAWDLPKLPKQAQRSQLFFLWAQSTSTRILHKDCTVLGLKDFLNRPLGIETMGCSKLAKS